ncbi:hypothetical protein Glove_5g27 [Diversispora epigaea]|uniref:Far11/STRP C-terminal domain-containing protein n=1 Tax=Diversispora epigaea TaxID=1348612 RepID=A0A397JR78_9GLOM|nr:hypothetical protein Glove_5g27 [Diversispora epigaea]
MSATTEVDFINSSSSFSEFSSSLGNTKIITSIYLNCRPDLWDEWIAPTDADAEVGETLVKTFPPNYAFPLFLNHDNHNNYHYNHKNHNNNYHNDNNHHHNNAAYLYADDLLLDKSFTENWEQWMEVRHCGNGSETSCGSNGNDDDYAAGNGRIEYEYQVPPIERLEKLNHEIERLREIMRAIIQKAIEEAL